MLRIVAVSKWRMENPYAKLQNLLSGFFFSRNLPLFKEQHKKTNTHMEPTVTTFRFMLDVGDRLKQLFNN